MPFIRGNNRYETMFKLGQDVFNTRTLHRGTVIGYGHEVDDCNYQPTLKVLVHRTQAKSTLFIEEDLSVNWVSASQASQPISA